MPGDTVILQSHRDRGRPAWIDRCLATVRDWAEGRGHVYRFVGDEMMRAVPAPWRSATEHYPQIAADLGRLYLIRDALAAGARQAVWVDADVAVFSPPDFAPEIAASHAFGREIWIESDARGRPRARRNVHNACMAFRPDQPVLAFYIHACETILARIVNDGAGRAVPAQIIGPKLLNALHSITPFPLIDDVAMLSPSVVRDLAGIGDGRALACLQDDMDAPASAANLSASLLGIDDEAMAAAVIDRLLAEPGLLRPAAAREAAS